MSPKHAHFSRPAAQVTMAGMVSLGLVIVFQPAHAEEPLAMTWADCTSHMLDRVEYEYVGGAGLAAAQPEVAVQETVTRSEVDSRHPGVHPRLVQAGSTSRVFELLDRTDTRIGLVRIVKELGDGWHVQSMVECAP